VKKENAKKQTLEQLHERRRQVVSLHKKGIKIMQIVAMTGLSYPPVHAAIDLFEAGGWVAIKPALRGRGRGDGRVPSAVQQAVAQRLIIDNRPEQLKMAFSLWRRAAVGQLFEQEFGIKLQLRSIGEYLPRWGCTPQKPIKRAYVQSPAAVQRCSPGCKVSTLPSSSAPELKGQRFTGVMRSPWSIRTCVAAAMPRLARPL
jgi:transposase